MLDLEAVGRLRNDWSNGDEIFRGIAGVAFSVTEYWMEATERVMDDLDFIDEQKLKGTVSLLHDEAYQLWLTVKEGTQPDRLTWDLFKITYQNKYVGANYTDTRREFLNLTQGDRSVAKYEAEFLRLSRYARGMVTNEYKRYVRFEDGLRDIEKAKIVIAEEVKRFERQNREKGKVKRDFESTSSGMGPKKKVRANESIRVGPNVTPAGVAICQLCNRRHPSECWRSTCACLRCGSTEHRVKDCPLRGNQVQALVVETVQPPRGVQ
ncbi:uncharacterized protein [Gossypium hirsutum]|uniref:CCHC-type domain-containing protein n=1 Tax=Gossypium hirsutum TaxID=3635 RepID=A0A1U8NYE5_GOSHI|nr:uncharacterized protein LOC107952254 [Gossypium hirsutum]